MWAAVIGVSIVWGLYAGASAKRASGRVVIRTRKARRALTVVVAGVALVFAACAQTPIPVDDSSFVGTYEARGEGSPELEIDPDGKLWFSDFQVDWIGGDSTDLVSGSGTWESGSVLHNAHTAFAVEFVAPPQVPGWLTWVYVRDTDSVFLWIDVVHDKRIEFQRVGP